MPAHDLAERRGLGGDVQRPFQARCAGQVVGEAPGLEPVQKPQPLLRERGRQRAAVRRPDEGGQPDALPHLPRLLDPDGKARQRGLLEHRPHREIHAEHDADARDHPGGQEGVTAQLEKIIAPPDVGYAQEVCPDAGEQLLDRVELIALGGGGLFAGRRR